MAGLNYILDTNAVSDYINDLYGVRNLIRLALDDGDELFLCQPVHFEALRGLIRANATRKQMDFEQELVPLLVWLPLIDGDWQQAARFWADTTIKGRQLSDVDLLVAALAIRLDATIISSDIDFDVLPVKRENWRRPTSE